MTRLILLVVYVAGIIIAKGFWSTFAAFIIIPWGWYLVLESMLNTF